MTRHTVEIERLGWMGQGVAKGPEQKVLFVKGVYPGDVVEVEFDEKGKRYQDAEFVNLVKPSPVRKDSPCEYFKQCGGCDYLDLSYEDQLRFKEGILKHSLEKYALTPLEQKPILGAKEIWNYRTRIQLRKKGSNVGFLKRKTNDIVGIDSCKIAHPRLNEELKNILQEPPTPSLSKIELTWDGESLKRSYDKPHGYLGFTQIHAEQNERLKELVTKYVQQGPVSKKVYELFCGDGNLSFSYMKDIEWFCGLDSNEKAIQFAQEKLGPHSDKRFKYGNIEYSPIKIAKEFEGCYDTLILDPPRQGIGRSLKYFISENVKKIIYISCSPLTFIQDVQILKTDFQFVSLQPIDMFPHTKHLELVALFVRS